MSIWTTLLESLHSALIDELTVRQPSPKPELGMPRATTLKKGEFELPDAELQSVLMCQVELEGKKGIAILGIAPACAQQFKLNVQTLSKSVFKRAESEFVRRGIRPLLISEELAGDYLPPNYPTPTRVIWIPITLARGKCYLGVGV